MKTYILKSADEAIQVISHLKNPEFIVFIEKAALPHSTPFYCSP